MILDAKQATSYYDAELGTIINICFINADTAIIEQITKNADDSYTIFLNGRMSSAALQEGFEHALGHIRRNDWEKFDVQQIEYEAHQPAAEPPREAEKPKPKRKRRTLTEAYLRKQAKRAAALAKHGLYETVEFVDGEEGEIVARRVLHA
jgi:hypothetical protein